MKRSRVRLEQVAEWKTLCLAADRAARGKRHREQIERFFAGFDEEIRALHQDILSGTVAVGRTTPFQIFDPKPRIIHAPVFRERVLHHAIIHHVGPVLDKALVDDTFACRVGKGALAAVQRAQQHARRFQWFAKIDIRQYFASIDHEILLRQLERRFKDEPLLCLLRRIVEAHQTAPGKGLPIGALTSQHFANFYLNSLDRSLLADPRVQGLVRYMDDTVLWCASKADANALVESARRRVEQGLCLQLHPRVQINRSSKGVTFCGFRVFSGYIRLTQRRRRLYCAARVRWEKRFASGEISASELQQGYAAAYGSVRPGGNVSCGATLPWRPDVALVTLGGGCSSQGAKRVIRGGSWNNNAHDVRSAYRNANHPENRDNNLGLRCVLTQRAMDVAS